MSTVPASFAAAEVRRVSDFFRYHGPWAPGVRLFRAIGFRAKAMVISAVFLIPLAFLAWQYFGDKAAAIEFSARERVGVDYMRHAMPVLQALVAERSAALSGDASALSARRSERQALWARLSEAQQADGSTLSTAEAFDAALKANDAMDAGAVSVLEVLARHDRAVDAMVTLIIAANDGSNLTLDPDLDTYYLMDGAIVAMPSLLDATGRLQALATALPLHSGQAEALSKAMVETAVRVGLDDARLDTALQKVAGLHPAFIADGGFADTRRAVVDFKRSTLAGGSLAAGAQTLSAVGTAQTRLLDQLDHLLSVRVDGMAQARNLTVLLLGVTLVGAVYFFLSF